MSESITIKRWGRGVLTILPEKANQNNQIGTAMINCRSCHISDPSVNGLGCSGGLDQHRYIISIMLTTHTGNTLSSQHHINVGHAPHFIPTFLTLVEHL